MGGFCIRIHRPLKFFFIFWFTTTSAVATIFNPVTTIDSRSIAKYSFSFSRSPLQNLNSTFLATSLNFGLFERLEIGTVPIFYLTKDHRHNYIFKYNFYRCPNIDWSLSYGESSYKVDLGTKKANLQLMALQLALNLHLPDQQWAIGGSVNQSCGYIDSKNTLTFATSYRCAAEVGLDLQYKIAEDKRYTERKFWLYSRILYFN